MNMEIIGDSEMLYIIKKTLNFVDPRLVDHGERVAYILYKMFQLKGIQQEESSENLIILALLHDIGAYKVEEIDKMFEFETSRVWEHSIYGYLFLKNISPLKDEAAAILFHHLPYNKFKYVQNLNQSAALLIKLADRVDVLHSAGKNDIQYIVRNKERLFDGGQVEWFCEAEKEYHIFDKLSGEEYINELQDVIKQMSFTKEEKKQYLQMIAYSIDFRSEFMVLHTITTVSMSCAIGEYLGLDPLDMEKLYYGALLHDIGKVSTPVEILEKPGRLTDAEMDIMRNHVVISEQILSGCVDSEICNIAVRHHEKIDGSGYPRGLKGSELTLKERIVAVADIVSALTRRRSYKEPFDKEQVMRILTQMSNENKICPTIAKIVMEHFDLFMKKSDDSSRNILHMYTHLREEYERILDLASTGKLCELSATLEPLNSVV